MENSKKILIVEDDADISMVEEAYLESAGFETRILSEGTEVEGVIEKEHFDLILLDLMLPGKNGYEICREIRDRVDIPILMVTARTESVDKIRGLGIGGANNHEEIWLSQNKYKRTAFRQRYQGDYSLL